MLVSSVIVATVSVLYWTGRVAITEVVARVDPVIYAPDHNIGVLNEAGLFHIYLENNVNNSITRRILFSAEGHVVRNETITLAAEGTRDLTLSQKLIFPGTWTIQVLDQDEGIVAGYSFLVVINRAEAKFRISQLDETQFSKNLSITAVIISLLALLRDVIRALIRRVVVGRRSEDVPSYVK